MRESIDQDSYAGYHSRKDTGVSGTKYTDDRLPNKSLVIGVQVTDNNGMIHYRAYPLTQFSDTAVTNDTVNEVPLLIFHDKDSFATAVFKRKVDDSTLTFTRQGDYFAQDNFGTQWNLITGEATSGKHKGARLERLLAVNIYWFAWARYYPKTTIYR